MRENINCELAPSILSADFANLKKSIELVEKAGVKYLHIDIMDGHFVPNISFGAVVVKAIRKYSNAIFDFHLMIEEPDRYIKDFVEAGADSITVHYEACKHLHRTIQLIKSYGVKAAVALNPATNVNVLEDIIKDLDMVLIMSVNPGFGGQKYIDSEEKIKKLKELINLKNPKCKIEIDGGVKLDNLDMLKSYGVDIFVAGSAIFDSEDVENTTKQFIEKLKKN